MLIGENYKIETDKYNIVLYSKREINAEKSARMKAMLEARYGEKIEVDSEDDGVDKADKNWVVSGYYATVGNSLKGLVELDLKKSELKDFQEIVNRVTLLKSDIDKALAGLQEKALKLAVFEKNEEPENGTL